MTRPGAELPESVSAFLTAREAGDVDAALAVFAADAEVTDDGRTYRGTEQVREFLEHAGSSFTYTTTLLGTEVPDGASCVVHQRVEGDFPGGVVDLAYRFALADGLVTRLAITA